MTDSAPYAADLTRRLAKAQRAWRAPAVVAAVVRDGQLAWSGAVGDAVVGSLPADLDTAFRIGSITKTFTAVLVHQLRDEGLLDLDDRLEAHLPGTRHSSLTLRRLLAHSSGLQREVGDMWISLEVPDRDRLLRELEAADQVLPPDTAHHYSNLAYAVLGDVVGQVTGSSWAEQLQQRLLGPLGMTSTGVAASGNAAQGYFTEPYADAVREETPFPTGAAGPAMQLWSTAGDLARWAAFLADPEPAVLAVTTLEQMRQPLVVFDPSTFSLAWGAGLMLRRTGERVLHGHGGAMPGFLAGCYAFRDDHERAGAVVLTNTGQSADPEGLAAELLTAALDADPRSAPAWVPGPVPEDVLALLGPWWTEGAEVLVEWREACLTMIGRGGAENRRTRFVRVDPDTWQAVAGRERGEYLRVVRATDADHLRFAGYAYTREPRAFAELGDLGQ